MIVIPFRMSTPQAQINCPPGSETRGGTPIDVNKVLEKVRAEIGQECNFLRQIPTRANHL